MLGGVTPMSFILPAGEDGWPPFRVECLYGDSDGEVFLPKQAPFFLKGVSVDDEIRVVQNYECEVVSWVHVRKSSRSVVWLMQLDGTSVDHACRSSGYKDAMSSTCVSWAFSPSMSPKLSLCRVSMRYWLVCRLRA